MRRHYLLPTLLLIISLASAARLQAQDATSGRYARIVVIQPRVGQDSAFEAGYRRHLAWHGAHRDSWTWRGWSFVLGDRLDAFMDGTFGHQLTDFDTPVDPAGDGADNRANVEPYAQFLSHAVYERLDSLGIGAPLPDDSPFLALTTYSVIPGQSAAFERQIAAARSGITPAAHFAWYRLVRGGSAPAYLLLQPAATLSAAAGAVSLPSNPGAAAAGAIVRDIRTEVLRYRPDMSYVPVARKPAD